MNIEAGIWTYWGLCLIAAIALVAHRQFAMGLLGPPPASRTTGYRVSLTLAWLLTLLAAGGYVVLTKRLKPGSYALPDLVTFALLNGTLEQCMFIFWFLAGCYLARRLGLKHPAGRFLTGYSVYAIYSGLIHAWFWMKVLPAHLPAGSVMVPALSIMSLSWMWLLWRYRSVLAIVAMHVTMDMLMIGHLHSHWFDGISRTAP
jgi:chlorophyllide a hydrolase